MLSVDNLQGPNEPRDLKFKEPPDFEAPKDANGDNVYKVILIATDDGGLDDVQAAVLEDMRPVTVFVDNVQEGGTIMLSVEGEDEDQPLVGNMITAMVADPDEGVANVTWQWFRGPNDAPGTTFTAITGETTNEYTPVAADAGMFLRAQATYTDTLSDPDNPDTLQLDERVQKLDGANVVAKDPDVPADLLYKVMETSQFAVKVAGEDDEDGDAGPPPPPEFGALGVERMVAENARVGDRVGDPVVAARGARYALSSENDVDHDNFAIDMYGQITVADINADANVITRPDLDYEVKSRYVVIVTATGAAGGTDAVTVTITLIDLNESPVFNEASRDTDTTPFTVHSGCSTRTARARWQTTKRWNLMGLGFAGR